MTHQRMRHTLVTHQLPINNLTTMTNTKKKKIKHTHIFLQILQPEKTFYFFSESKHLYAAVGYTNINSKIEFLTLTSVL